MKSGKPNEPKNKARLRMEAFKAARGIPSKAKSGSPIVPKLKKKVLPAQKAPVSIEENVSAAKNITTKKKALPAKKAASPKKKYLTKPKGASPKKKRGATAKISVAEKLNPSHKSGKKS